ncbi:MAG: amidohydrolase family protein [Bacillota bacterium]|nr:amidohydrolase family protein [Bacillota bacterium]
MIVDAHVHIFPRIEGYGPKGKIRSASYGMVDQGDGIPIHALPPLCELTKHTREMLLSNMEWAGVDRAVLLQCPCYGDWSEYVLETCRLYPDKFIGAAFFDPWRSDAKEYYEKNIANGPWQNVKIEFSQAGGLCGVYPDADLNSEDMQWLWDRLELENKTVSFDLGEPGDRSYQTEQIGKIAKKHPGLRIVLCHVGQPSYRLREEHELKIAWEKQIMLGLLPNVWFDVSAMPYHVQNEEEYPFPSTKKYFIEALEMIGPKKLMWGSDIPWLLGIATYRQLVSHAKHLVEDLSEQSKRKILCENAIQVYWDRG